MRLRWLVACLVPIAANPAISESYTMRFFTFASAIEILLCPECATCSSNDEWNHTFFAFFWIWKRIWTFMANHRHRPTLDRSGRHRTTNTIWMGSAQKLSSKQVHWIRDRTIRHQDPFLTMSSPQSLNTMSQHFPTHGSCFIDLHWCLKEFRDLLFERRKLFEMNAILNREAYPAIYRKGFRRDLFNERDSCTIPASDRFNMDYKWRVQDEVIKKVEQKVTKFFQTPVEIDEARTMSREVLTHRVQELRRTHGQEWILVKDGSFDSGSNGPADWGVFVLSPSRLCWLLCGATETDRDQDEWHGEEDHTNNTGELKPMLVAHLFIQNMQDVTSWSTRLLLNRWDTRNVTVMGHECKSSSKFKKTRTVWFHSSFDEQVPHSGHRRIPIAEANMKKRIVHDSEMDPRQATNHLNLIFVLQTLRRQIRRKEKIYIQWTPGHSKHLGNEMADGLAFLGSQSTCDGTQWMKDALKEVHKKATEIGMVTSVTFFVTCGMNTSAPESLPRIDPEPKKRNVSLASINSFRSTGKTPICDAGICTTFNSAKLEFALP